MKQSKYKVLQARKIAGVVRAKDSEIMLHPRQATFLVAEGVLEHVASSEDSSVQTVESEPKQQKGKAKA